MKKIKFLLGFFALSVIVSISGANAAHYTSFVGITLPSNSNSYTSDPKDKTVQSFQYVHTTGARDNLTGGTRAVSAQTVKSTGSTSSWISVPIDSTVTWGSGNQATGSYSIKLKATKSTWAKVTYTGVWYLDNTLL